MDRTAPGTVELPDSYAKEAGSNNNKWMLLDQLAFDAINKNYEDVYESTDITKAYGATLDKFGQWLDQKRGQLNDPQYRFMLLTKILRNLSKGTAGDVIKLISRMLHASPADIKIAEVSGKRKRITIFCAERRRRDGINGAFDRCGGKDEGGQSSAG